MKKYYAKQCNPEDFEYQLYYDEDAAAYDHFFADGGRDFKFNMDEIERLRRACEDITSDCEDEEDFTEIKRIVDYYLDIKDLTDDDYEIIVNLAGIVSSTWDDHEYIAQLLGYGYGVEFTTGTIHGCCQGDWARYICPKSMEDSVPFIEAVLFGTGTEYMITEEPIESPDDFDDADVFSVYTEKWRDDDIKAFLAEEVSCDVSELVVLNIDKIHTHKTFTYKEI